MQGIVMGLGIFCQLGQVFWLIAGFLYVLLAAVVVTLGFLFDVVTWFSLQLYQYYIPVFMHAWQFFEAGLGMQCS